jgi:zinc transporter ZupT
MMEAARAERGLSAAPLWMLAAVPLTLIAIAIAAFALFGDDTLEERRGPPVEELAVERTVLRPGEIELTLRNTGPDAVTVAQVAVADAFVNFEADPGGEVGRLGDQKLTLEYDWQEGSPYLVSLLTSTGATIEHEIDVAVETPETSASFFGLMTLLGVYVGVIPVLLGMLFMPLLRRISATWITAFMALTIGLLGFLAIDGYLEGTELGDATGGAFGGVELLFLGAALSYLVLTATGRWLESRKPSGRGAQAKAADAWRLALMVSIGIGLHNLGEGLAIGSAYTLGALALGAFLVIGFAIHNTTEGLAIVAPLARGGQPVSRWRLVLLGLIAGAPAILGAVIGASINNQELAVFLLGAGVGAIVQVIVQLVPSIRDRAGNALHPVSVAGIVAGAVLMYTTGLLVSL